MGSENTRKSSTIRALTGFARNGNGRIKPFDVRLTDGTIIKICVFLASPQENNTSMLEFVNKIADIDREWNILMVLNPDDQAVEYIEAIAEANGYEIYITPLGMREINGIQRELHEHRLNPRIRPVIADSGNMPANEIAAQIRNEWD
jgi:hypothetical protein